ncbi:MAG: ROK family protein [Lachnospiraceae bacterium]|jgi:predicted NBD/HSP70 family sugar kinase|nr:ROK family protein [Lachnospiraceae bacterium]
MNICVLDIGGTFIKGALMDEEAHLLKQWKVKSRTADLDSFLESLDQSIAPYLEGAKGIAVSMPGKIDSAAGIARTGGAFLFIRDLPVVSILEERYHLPAAVDNDGKCAASAENWMGALKDVPNGLVYVIGTGLGGGIVLNNQVVRGSNFAAGELSFCLMDKNRPFGLDNMMSSVVSAKFLLEQYQERAGLDEAPDGIEFFGRVNEGEELAVDVLRNFCRLTARYMFDLQAVLDVDRIAVGGGISAQPVLLQMLEEELKEAFLYKGCPMAITQPKLVRCRYGNDANLIGALKNFLDRRGADIRIGGGAL